MGVFPASFGLRGQKRAVGRLGVYVLLLFPLTGRGQELSEKRGWTTSSYRSYINPAEGSLG